MRPLRLEMTAFGPYPKEVILDFAILANQSMFLITGPTGSGKTSILDAIVYALYGQTSGGLRDGSDMRSDYADTTTPTSVVFEFQVGAHRYRMERTPKQELQKKRGTGTRTVLATASISEWSDDAWKLLTTKAQEIRDYVQQIIGFRVDQFLQVVLLPQGDFRKLLVAPTSEREILLHTIFKTSIYKRMQDVLKEELAESTVGIQDTLQKVEILLGTYKVNTLQDLVALVEEEHKLLTAREGERKEKQEQYESLQTAYTKYEAYIHLLARKEQHSKALASHKEGEREHIALGETIDRWERLQNVRMRMKDYEKLQTTFSTDAKKLETLKSSLESVEASLQLVDDKWQQLIAQEESYTAQQEQYYQLQGLQQEVEQYRELCKNRTTLDSDREKKVEEQKTLQQMLVTSRAELDVHRSTVGELNLKLQSYASVSEEKLCIRELWAWWESIKGVVEKLRIVWDRRAIQEKELEEARKVSMTRERVYHHNEQLLRQHQAYEVSLQLKEQEPCPVCGSLDHPQLTQAPSEEIVRETVDRLRQEFQASQTQVVTLQTKLTHSEQEVEQYGREWSRLCEAYPKVTQTVRRGSLIDLADSLQAASEALKVAVIEDRIQWWKTTVDEEVTDQGFKDIQKELGIAEITKLELEERLRTLQNTLQTEEANLHARELELTALEGQLESVTQELQHITIEMRRIENSIAPFTVDTYRAEVKKLAETLKQYEADRKAIDEERQASQEKQMVLTAEVKALKEQQVRMIQDMETLSLEIEQVLQEESLTMNTFKEQSDAFDELPNWKDTVSTYHNESLRLASLLEEVEQNLAAYATVPEEFPRSQ